MYFLSLGLIEKSYFQTMPDYLEKAFLQAVIPEVLNRESILFNEL